jgi:hypothetical protein
MKKVEKTNKDLVNTVQATTDVCGSMPTCDL